MKVLKKIAVIFVFVFILLQACSLQQMRFHEFVITDMTTGDVLDTYEYDTATDQLNRLITYGDNQQAKKTIEFSYDSEGNISRALVQKRGLNGIEIEMLDYTVSEETDDQERLIKTTVSADNGELVETYYLYNDQGSVRGISQVASDGSVLLKECH